MKLTCCTWDCLLEHAAHSRHITQIGIYFILRNNWHTDVPWNISKIFYWISFFSVQHMIYILSCMIFLFSISCKLYILWIGVLDWHIHCARVWYEIIKIVEHSIDFHLRSCKPFDKVENVSGNIFLTDAGFCSEILKSALFPSFGKTCLFIILKKCLDYWIVYTFLLILFSFYTPVWKTGRIMPWQCPSVRPSTFSGLFFNMLWDINLKLGIYIQ